MSFEQEFYSLPEAAAFLGCSERSVILLSAEKLPVCFHWRGNLAIYQKGQAPQLSLYWFDGYLRSRTPVKIKAETHHTKLRSLNGMRVIEKFTTCADTLTPGTVKVVKSLSPAPVPPALLEGQFLTRLDDKGIPTSTPIPAENWLFHTDDLRALLTITEDTSATPAGHVADSQKFTSRIGWQVALFDAWPMICKMYGGRNPTAAEAIKYLQKNDNGGTILAKTDGGSLWWKPQRRKAKEVTLKTVENTISALRARGELPA